MTTSPRRDRRSFTDEFKADAVAMVTELGRTRADVARDLELNESTLGRWVAKAAGTKGTGTGSHRRTPDPNSDDVFEMRKEIARLKDENIFLKKAAAYAGDRCQVRGASRLVSSSR